MFDVRLMESMWCYWVLSGMVTKLVWNWRSEV